MNKLHYFCATDLFCYDINLSISVLALFHFHGTFAFQLIEIKLIWMEFRLQIYLHSEHWSDLIVCSHNLFLRGHSNKTWHPKGRGGDRGSTKCRANFFCFLNSDLNAFGNKKSSLRNKDSALTGTFVLIQFTIQSIQVFLKTAIFDHKTSHGESEKCQKSVAYYMNGT